MYMYIVTSKVSDLRKGQTTHTINCVLIFSLILLRAAHTSNVTGTLYSALILIKIKFLYEKFCS